MIDSRAKHPAHPAKNPHHAKRRSPAQEINAQYAAFLAAFRVVEQSYVQSLNQQTSNMIPVSATVTPPYASGSPVMVVDDAAVFGPPGPFNPPVTATAFVGSVSIGQFILTGSSGNQLTINISASSLIPLNPGTVLTANMPVSAQSAAAAIFPGYIVNST